jgi:hypothetical protein
MINFIDYRDTWRHLEIRQEQKSLPVAWYDVIGKSPGKP